MDSKEPEVDVPASPAAADSMPLPETLGLGSQGKAIKWFFLKNLKTEGKFYPAAEALFNKKFKRGKISTINFVRIVANIVMIETGFVPLMPNKMPVCSVQELLSLSLMERMIRLIDSLLMYFEEGKSKLDKVNYTFIKAKDSGIEKSLLSPASSKIDYALSAQEIGKFEFSKENYRLLIWYSGEKTFMTLQGKDCDLDLEVGRTKVWSKSVKNKDKLRLEELISCFVVGEFLTETKRRICYPFMDKFNGLTTEYQGFKLLPDELLENLARYLDVRSLTSLLQTSHRMNRILDNEVIWKMKCERIPTDFPQYGYTSPSHETLRLRLRQEGQSFKESFKSIYVQARSDLQAQRRRRIMRDYYNFWLRQVRYRQNRLYDA